jgi:hypothetical protein
MGCDNCRTRAPCDSFLRQLSLSLASQYAAKSLI